MVTTEGPGEIHVPGIGRIGHLRKWEKCPDSFDAWVEWPGREDEQVCWGGTRPWVILAATRRYQELLMDDLDGAAYRMRTKGERREFSERVHKVLSCARFKSDMLEEHYKLVQQGAARIERETS